MGFFTYVARMTHDESDPITIESLNAEAILPHLDALSRLRIAVFREWPYLYDGDDASEREYLVEFAAAADALLVEARDGDTIVGASTAMPLAQAHPEFQRPFLERGDDIGRIFYFGESVLLPPYRGRGIGHRFFDEREAHAARLGGYATLTFCAVIRPDDHPLRPADARSHDAFWTKRGYVKQPDLVCTFPWKDVGMEEETEKPLVFWTRDVS